MKSVLVLLWMFGYVGVEYVFGGLVGLFGFFGYVGVLNVFDVVQVICVFVVIFRVVFSGGYGFGVVIYVGFFVLGCFQGKGVVCVCCELGVKVFVVCVLFFFVLLCCRCLNFCVEC